MTHGVQRAGTDEKMLPHQYFQDVLLEENMIPTIRRIEYIRGYLELGMLANAAEELKAICEEDQSTVGVLEIRMELHTAAKQWELAAAAAKQVVRVKPNEPSGWISWAYATRRHLDIPSAEAILLQAEQRLGTTCALIHYNLACYRCQQGDYDGAKERLLTACRMEALWKTAALNDPDLIPLREFAATL